MKQNIFDEYIFHHNNTVNKHGKKGLVIMQVGSFYEMYGLPGEGPDLKTLSRVVQYKLTRRDKSQPPSRSNYQIVGIPVAVIGSKIKVLLDHGYVIVRVDEVTPKPNVTRRIIETITVGTYIDELDDDEPNNMLSIYVEYLKNLDGVVLPTIGMTCIDLSTGRVMFTEAYSTALDRNKALDDAVLFINNADPKEILLRCKVSKKLDGHKDIFSMEKLIDYLELSNRNVNSSMNIHPSLNDINYQNQFLEKIYDKHNMGSVIEYLDLERYHHATTSMMILCEYIYSSNKLVIQRLDRPICAKKLSTLELGNNALYQLDIVSKESNKLGGVRSLFDILNKTSTAMGMRFLKQALQSPLIDPKDMEYRYKCISRIMRDDKEKKIPFYKILEEILLDISDIERAQRRILLSTITPNGMYRLIDSYKSIKILFGATRAMKTCKEYVTKEVVTDLGNLLKLCDKTFDMGALETQTNSITKSIFTKGIHKDIDDMQVKIDRNNDIIDNICTILSDAMPDKNKKQDCKVKFFESKNLGFHLRTTNIRGKLLLDELSKRKEIVITANYTIKDGDLTLKKADQGNVILVLEEMKKISDEMYVLKEKLEKRVKEELNKFINKLVDDYSILFKDLVTSVASIDFIVSSAKCAKMYNYCRPSTVDNDKSGLYCKRLRHPIIERINDDVAYVPHDVKLSWDLDDMDNMNDMDGMLVFGCNSVGKSSFMKATGLAVVMAQAGMFVPADEFKLSPYHYLFARITGNDDLFKGLSSFTLEMTELDSIMSRLNQEKVLVIGDEVCRGTETKSGTALVAAAIVTLSKNFVSFIFATHLHDIPRMKRIQDLDNVRSFHITLDYDPKDNSLIFDRILKPGAGEDVYGVTIAQHIIKNKEFINLSREILNEIDDKPSTLVSTKVSRYNSSKYMDKCENCGKQYNESMNEGNLDTHHILNRKNCKDGFSLEKKHIGMNSKANLVVLCKSCHYDAHHDKLSIEPAKMTSNGPRFIFKSITKSKTKSNN